MKKITILLALFASVTLLCQEKNKGYKSKNIHTVVLGEMPDSQESGKSRNTDVSARTGTSNGSIVADLSVSNTGGVNYTIPINVPPGLNNVQPDIALTFDSQSGNGLAGWGWNISGISVITRIPANSFYDGRVGGVNLDLNDRFALDGQRLKLVSGSYGASGSVYETEQKSNIKVVAYDTHSDVNVQGPKYFKVFYPDGSIAHYGFYADSRSPVDYAISYWENPQDIRVSYSYTNADNTLSIDKIKYGSRGTATAINEIEFMYDDVPNNRIIETAYVGGKRFIRNKNLSDILVKGQGGSLYRKYHLDYSRSSLSYKRLEKVFEETGDGSESRNIAFQYSGSAYSSNQIHNAGLVEVLDEATQLDVGDIALNNSGVVSLDLNGNGKMDFILYPKTGNDAKKKFWFFEDVQNSGGFNYNLVNTGLFQDVFPVNWLNQDSRLMPNQALALVKNIGDRAYFDIMVKAAPSAGNTLYTAYSKTWDLPQVNNPYSSGQLTVPQKYVSGDFDGDGLSDILAIGEQVNAQNGPYSVPVQNIPRVHAIKLDRRDGSEVGIDLGLLNNALSGNDQLFALDATGDGKTNLIHFEPNNKVQVYGLNSSNTAIELLWEHTDGDLNMEFVPMPGDYNGDGKSDFLIPLANNSDAFFMLLSTGKGYDRKEYLHQSFEYRNTDYNGKGTLYGYNLFPADINGDGKTDIIEYNTITYNGNDNGEQYIRLHQNATKYLSADQPNFIPTDPLEPPPGDLRHYPIPIFLSSNDENPSLEFATISNKWVRSFRSLKDHREDVTLSGITNNGVQTDISYDQVNIHYVHDADPNYVNSYSASAQVLNQVFPFVNVDAAPSFKVVRELLQTGSGISRTRSFKYENAISTANGHGFVGFEVVKQSNWYGTNVPAVWTISKYNPLLRGALFEQIVSDSYANNPSQYASKVNYFYDYQLIDNPVFPAGSGYPFTLNPTSPVTVSRVDEAEYKITLSPGFNANASNFDYSARIIPPINQSGQGGYTGAIDIRLKRMETDNGLTGVLTTETYVYDQYDNRTKISTVFPGGSRVVDYTYYNNPSATNNTYHVGRQKTMKETMTTYGNTFSTEEEYEYNNNLVTKIKRKGNGTPWLVQELDYDIIGNIKSKTLKGGTQADRVQQFEYELNAPYFGRFMTKSTAVNGLAATFEYDPIDGSLTSSTGPYNLETKYDHDSWNRIWKVTDYLNHDTLHTYTPLSGGALKHTVDYPEGGMDETVYNAFGWTTRSGSLSLNNQWVYTDYEYYVSGQLKKTSEPHHGSASQWNTTIYDEYGRPLTEQLYTGRNINISYDQGTLSSTVNDGVKSVTTTLDALGNVAKSQDPGGMIDYTYHASGQLKTADYGGHVVTIGVDGWGRKTSLNDPSAGTYTYEYYDDFGDLKKETTPKGTTTYTYDDFGRVDMKTVVGDLTDLSLDYIYDPNTEQLSDINGFDNTNGNRAYTYEYIYGAYERLMTITEDTGLADFEYSMTYDQYGRVETETQIANLTGGATKSLTTKNVYDTSGLLKEIWNNGTPDKLWELNDITARGQAKTIALGNGINKVKEYDTYGYLEKIEDMEAGNNPSPTVALHTEYDFNQQRGTLNSRENFGFNWQEGFNYDAQDRLTTITGDVVKTMAYDNRGRIDDNTDLGDYTYATPKDYRLNEIDPNPAGETFFQQHPTQQITYNAFKKPIDIHQSGHGRVSFEYGPMMNRSTAYYGGEDQDKTLRRYRKHYSSIIPAEIVEDTQTSSTKIINYVGGDAYSAPIAHIKQTGTNALDEYHYLHRDYLGSILAITDAAGNVKEERHFGAWGTVDMFLDSSAGTTFDHTSLLGRGYTGHEHFFEVGLIHMNGRMYDANLGRFLSPDNYIQDPFNTQNYNRYAYVLNNPLLYTDPSGEEFLATAIAFVIANWGYFVGGAIVVGSAIWGDWDSILSNFAQTSAPPTPSNIQNNSQTTSSISRQSRGNGSLNIANSGPTSTGVRLKKDGTYEVVNGRADGNNGVYLVNSEGEYDINTSEKIGNSLTDSSFLYGDESPVRGARIDMNSREAQNFLNLLKDDDPGLVIYALKGLNGNSYDFKSLNLKEDISQEERLLHYYRGSVLDDRTIVSGRDTGNFGAGYVAARNGLSWNTSRTFFDMFQGYKDNGFHEINTDLQTGLPVYSPFSISREPATTVKAQRIGWLRANQIYNK